MFEQDSFLTGEHGGHTFQSFPRFFPQLGNLKEVSNPLKTLPPAPPVAEGGLGIHRRRGVASKIAEQTMQDLRMCRIKVDNASNIFKNDHDRPFADRNPHRLGVCPFGLALQATAALRTATRSF